MSLFPFTRKRDGVHASFGQHERQLLDQLLGQLAGLLDEPDQADPAVARLLPPGYSGDAEAEAEFRRLTVDDLAARKVESARVARESLAGDLSKPLSAQTAQAWLLTLTDLRLTLGARLGVTAEGFPDGADREARLMHDVYDWLGFVQETLVRALDR